RREAPGFFRRTDRRLRLVLKRVQCAAQKPGKRLIRIETQPGRIAFPRRSEAQQQVVLRKSVDGQSEGVLGIDIKGARRAPHGALRVSFRVRTPSVEDA